MQFSNSTTKSVYNIHLPNFNEEGILVMRMRRKNPGDAEDRGYDCTACETTCASAAGLAARRRVAPIPSNWQSTVTSEAGKTVNKSNNT